jgi:predicted metal-binding membrane protein
MASADVARPQLRWLNPRRMLVRHPELGAAAVVIAAWVTLLVLDARGAHGGGSHAGMSGMAGMGSESTAAPHSAWSQADASLPSWVLMTVAMMGPAALADVRYTGLNSLRWRRRRAMAEFSAAYLSVWAAFGLVSLAAGEMMPGVPGPAALAVVLAAAAAWQLSPFKRRCLRGCHRSLPLPPYGWRADKGALWFGLRNGLYCLGTCWCLMLIMIAAPGGQLLWTAGLTAVITGERRLPRPRSATRTVATLLSFATVAALAVGNLLQ